jgi:hypothetical protein
MEERSIEKDSAEMTDVAKSGYYPGVFTEGLSKITKNITSGPDAITP